MMYKQIFLSLMVLAAFIPDKLFVYSGGAPGDTIGAPTGGNRYNSHVLPPSEQQQQQHHRAQLHSQHSATHLQQQQHHHSIVGAVGGGGSSNAPAVGSHALYHPSSGSGHPDHRNSYNLLSEAMSQAVSNEFSNMGSGSADGACHVDDLDCYSGNVQDRLGMEAIRTLHRQLDDDDNGNIDLSESDDFLREELKYDSGYQNRQKTFHFNDDKHISVKELWEAWLRSEVHNWTIEQTTDWLAQSVQLPQYVDLFKQHKVTGAALPRLAVNNMHYVSNVLGIKDPIHKQKIALKAMDVVLFGPPRETGTRWKDYILVILLLSAIIGCWYAYQQNKNAKRHLRRMAQDMEGLQRAEQSLQEMQKELERARMEQENVATEKLDLERRLKEAPALSSSNSDLEVQKLKKEIEMLRTELSRAEIELVDNCWSPPPQLQSWLQYTYELENKQHMKKRISAEKQLQSAREACEKLRKKRSSLVGAFVSTHGKSIDDVDRSIVEARNSLSEVTNELQERLHRWKQIESCLGINIVNNNGFSYLESILYGRGNGIGSIKSSRGRMTSSTDDLDDESVQGFIDNYSRSSGASGVLMGSNANTIRDDSSGSEDGADNQSVQFYLGGAPTPIVNTMGPPSVTQQHRTLLSLDAINHIGNHLGPMPSTPATAPVLSSAANSPLTTSLMSATGQSHQQQQQTSLNSTATTSVLSAAHTNFAIGDSIHNVVIGDESHQSSPSASSERSIPVPPRTKKQVLPSAVPPPPSGPIGRTPLPPPRKSAQSQMFRSQSTDLVPMEIYSYLSKQGHQSNVKPCGITVQQSITNNSPTTGAAAATGNGAVAATTTNKQRVGHGKMVKQHSTASQQSTSSTSSSVQSAPPTAGGITAETISSSPTRRDDAYGDREQHQQLQQQQQHIVQNVPHKSQKQHHNFNAASFLGQQISGALSLQSLCGGKAKHGNSGKTTATATTTPTSIASSTHSDTQMDDFSLTSTVDDSASVDCGGELKKRRRKLRFPFGGKKSISSTTTAAATANNSKSKSTS